MQISNIGVKSFIVIVIIAISIHQSEATVKKVALLKAKAAIIKAPHVAAKFGVLKEIKAKAKLAAATSLAALKAKKLLAVSVLTAPIRYVKKTILLKKAGFKALKAAKLAKIQTVGKIAANLKKGPLILPIKVAVPAKSIAAAKATFKAPLIGSAITGALTAPFSGVLSSVSSLPILSSFAGLGKSKPVQEVVAPAPIYRFIPSAGFDTFNRVAYAPQVEVEVPAPVQVVPHETYGVPN